MLIIPDLNRLRVFQAVYTARSFVKAAQALHITRSAVSQSIKALEGDLETKLFLRNSKKVVPTEAAQILFGSTESLFTELQMTVARLETGRQNLSGHLRIGAPQDFGSQQLTEAIAEFRRTNDKITFELVLATPLVLLDMVSEDKLNFAFVDNGDVHAKNFPVSITTVMEEKFILVSARNYHDKHIKGRDFNLALLKTLAFVDYLSHAPVAKMWIKTHFGRPSPDLNVVFSAESVHALIRAISRGVGVGVVPEQMVAADIEAGKLRKIFSPSRELVNKISLARRLERTVTAREKAFVDFFKALTF